MRKNLINLFIKNYKQPEINDRFEKQTNNLDILMNKEAIKLNKKFGYTVSIAFLVITAYHLLFKHKQDNIIGIIALVLLATTLLKPYWLTPLRLGWDKLGHVLGIFNTYVLLSLFYCLILTPLGLIMRLLGKDILKLKKSNSQSSYWELSPTTEESKMENQF